MYGEFLELETVFISVANSVLSISDSRDHSSKKSYDSHFDSDCQALSDRVI